MKSLSYIFTGNKVLPAAIAPGYLEMDGKRDTKAVA
jgi:hypothetical protein